MKNLFFVSTLLIMAVLSIQSCSDNGIDEEGSFLTADIDGVPFNISSDLFAYATDLTSSFNVYGIMDIDAQKSMYIQLPLGFSEGTHQFNEEVFAYVIDGDKAWSTLVGAGEGSVTIESIEGVRFAGTFDFTAFDFDNPDQSMSVTSGRFDVLKR